MGEVLPYLCVYLLPTVCAYVCVSNVGWVQDLGIFFWSVRADHIPAVGLKEVLFGPRFSPQWQPLSLNEWGE
jgi:hypothetical protein